MNEKNVCWQHIMTPGIIVCCVAGSRKRTNVSHISHSMSPKAWSKILFWEKEKWALCCVPLRKDDKTKKTNLKRTLVNI